MNNKNQIIEPEDNQPDLEAIKQSPAPLILFKLTGKLVDNSKNNAQVKIIGQPRWTSRVLG